MVVGAAVWLVLGLATVAWAVVLMAGGDAVLRARTLARWLLSAWAPRLAILAAWAVVGWHVFCQRP